VKISDI